MPVRAAGSQPLAQRRNERQSRPMVLRKDLSNGRLWSAGHQPVCAEANWYRVLFASDRVTFIRRDGDIETQMEIAVASDDAAEVRRVIIYNRSSTAREIEITSYAEIVMQPLDVDRAHPAFGNLFVQTEWLPDSSAILAMRRPRSVPRKSGGAGMLQQSGRSRGLVYV